jgi:hypothetical protein
MSNLGWQSSLGHLIVFANLPEGLKKLRGKLYMAFDDLGKEIVDHYSVCSKDETCPRCGRICCKRCKVSESISNDKYKKYFGLCVICAGMYPNDKYNIILGPKPSWRYRLPKSDPLFRGFRKIILSD